MKYFDEYQDPDLARRMIERICDLSSKIPGEIRLMEVCGTHTTAIGKTGVRKLIPEKVELLSGPGCPVCVTPNSYLCKAFHYSRTSDVIITTFGDMMRVPVSGNSLEKEKSDSGHITIVYSAADSLKIAEENPQKKIIFLAVGFETTAPTVAATIKIARKKKIKNFYILTGHKLIPPALSGLVNDPELQVNGFICPGHVSTIIGKEPYEFIACDYKLPCVIAGFETLDVIQAVFMLLLQLVEKKAKVEIQYRRAVRAEGNKKALKLMYEVFETCESEWRGLGKIPESGLKVRSEFSSFDAESRFPVEVSDVQEDAGCICGEVLRGIKKPSDCKLFKTRCTPENPVGACMVSSEGTCAAYFKYSEV